MKTRSAARSISTTAAALVAAAVTLAAGGVPRRPGDKTIIHVWQNSARGVNENYARELMELHTLGVDAGYTQKDVQEVARAFTGWTLSMPRLGGAFRFDPRMRSSSRCRSSAARSRRTATAARTTGTATR